MTGTIRMPPTPTATPGKEPAALHSTLAEKAFYEERSDCKIQCASFPATVLSPEPMVPIPEPLALNPTTESKIFHLAEPGAGDPKQMPSVDIGPHGLKGSQGKLPPET